MSPHALLDAAFQVEWAYNVRGQKIDRKASEHFKKVLKQIKKKGQSEWRPGEVSNFDWSGHRAFWHRLRRFIDTAHARRRKSALQKILLPEFAKMASRDLGFGRIPDHAIDTTAFVAACQAACKDRLAQLDRELADKRKKLPVLVPIAEGADFRNLPGYVSFALSPELISIAAGYLGTFPTLTEITLWYSAQNDLLTHGQLFHVDHRKARNEFRIFINVTDVTPESGPVIVLPRAESAKLYAKGHHRRVLDNAVDLEKTISMAGPSGSIFYLDAARCYHQGSRTRRGHRVVAMLQYTTPWDQNEPLPREHLPDDIAARYYDDPIYGMLFRKRG